MRVDLHSIGILVCVTLLGPLAAQGAPLRLTIDEAVARATAANLELSASEKTIDLAKANLQRSRAWLPANPYLSAGSQPTVAGGIGSNYGFVLSQQFEVAGQRGKRIEAAAEGVNKARWDVRSAQQALAATVKATFVQALVGLQRVSIANEEVDAVCDLANRLEKRQRLSDAQRIDLNRARIQESRARRAVAAAEQTRQQEIGALRRLLNLPFDQEIELAGAPQSEVKEPLPTAEIVALALRRRADLKAQRHEAQRAARQVDVVSRETVPDVTVSGYVSSFQGDTLTGGDVGFAPPLFVGKTPDLHEAVLEHQYARLQAEELARTVADDIVVARRACVVAGADFQILQKEIVPKSGENLQLQRRLYERGALTESDFLSAVVDSFSARQELVDALQAYNEALIELERVAAGPLD